MITRIATLSDIPNLVKNRVEFSNSLRGGINNKEEFAQATEKYMREHFSV